MRAAPLLLIAAALLGGCAGDIFPGNIDRENGGGSVTLPGPGGSGSRFAASGSHYTGEIDIAGSGWVYIDLDTQTQVNPSNPAADAGWDLAFSGTDIKINGGDSGAPPGGNAVIIYGDKSAEGTAYPWESFDAGAPPPNAAPYTTDEKAGLLSSHIDYAFTHYPAADQEPDTATGAGDYGWYRSAGLTGGNAVSVRGNVAYVLRSVECRYWKLRFTAYTGGKLGFDVQQVNGPSCATSEGGVAPMGRATVTSGSDSTTVATDASDDTDWVYIDMEGGRQVTPAAPADDDSWDLAVRRSDFKLNGGASGSKNVEISDMLRDDWDARSSAPAGAAYHTDADGALAFQTYPVSETPSSAACGGVNGDHGWYYYSGFCNDGEGIHHISPRDVVYILRSRSNKLWKFRVLDYYDSAGSSAHPSFEYAPVSGL